MTLLDSIETPTLLLDEQRMLTNIRRMAQKALAQHIRFRPHFKTHQSARIGEVYRSEGVTAITVSSVEMAAYFARAGWQDITIAFPVNVRQMHTLQQLAQQVHLGLLVESAESLRALQVGLTAPADIWLKIDVGSHRTGIPIEDVAEISNLVALAQEKPHLTLRGLLSHAGHTYRTPANAVPEVYLQSIQRLLDLRAFLQHLGFTGLEISVGDTPSASLSPNLGEVDEIRPGNFVFYDAKQLSSGTCSWQDVAIALACPVVAKHPQRNEVVLYGGVIHFSSEFYLRGEQRAYGMPVLWKGNGWGEPIEGGYIAALSQEHGILHLPSAEFEHIHVGDLAFVIPAHSCITVSAMKRYLTLNGEIVTTLNEAC